MARDSGGAYTLPAGNPVVTATTISSSVHNTTQSDIANEITDSLSRSGKGGMSAALKLVDGAVGAPGLSFNNDPNTGIYRPTDDQLAVSAGGVQVGLYRATGLQLPIATAVDLADTDNALNIGSVAGVHLAFSPAIIQGKASSTTAATNLDINPLGGTVTLYAAASKSLVTSAAGSELFSGDDITVTLGLNFDSTGAAGYVGSDVGETYLGSAQTSGDVALYVRDSLDTDEYSVRGVADGPTELYDTGLLAARTDDNGFDVIDTNGNDPVLSLYQDDGTTRGGYIQAHSTIGLIIYSQTNDVPIILRAQNTGGSPIDLINADPDINVKFYNLGSLCARTSAGGFDFFDTSGDDPFIGLYQDDGATRNAFIQAHGASGLIIRGEVPGLPVQIDGRNVGDTAQEPILVGDPDGATTLYFNGEPKIATQQTSATDQSTGAVIRHADGSDYDVGMNVSPFINVGVTTTLSRTHVGKTVRYTASAIELDLTTATTDTAPDGSIWLVQNDSGGNITIDANAGVTLTWLEGGGGTAGDRTLSDGGVCTIQKRVDGQYFIWGVGLS